MRTGVCVRAETQPMVTVSDPVVPVAYEISVHPGLLARPIIPPFTGYRVAPASVDAQWADSFTEVSVAVGSSFQIEACNSSSEWEVLPHAQFPERDGRVRCFLPIVPSLSFAPINITSPAKESESWRKAKECGSFEFEMAIASSLLHKLLVQNKYLVGATFGSWPSRDRHQFWATFWVALHLVPERAYTSAEVDGILAWLTASPNPSILTAMAADLERRGFLVKESALLKGDNDGEPLFTLSRKQIEFVLDGDKLFHVRTSVAGRRPWWALPIASQYIAAPLPAEPCQPAVRFRCVLLDPEGSVETYRNLCVRLLPVEGGASVNVSNINEIIESVKTEKYNFVSFEHEFSRQTICSEVTVMVPADESCNGRVSLRIPPFRIDTWEADAQEWRMLQCQPMPIVDEACNHGRDSVRCFLPKAVELADAIASTDVAEGADDDAVISTIHFDRLTARLMPLFEEGLLSRWPTKQKQQAAVIVWLSLRFAPGRVYQEAEVDWIIAMHFTRASVPDSPVIRKEFDRYGLVQRQLGGAGFQRLQLGFRAALERLLT
eukprot:TRINITY_DN34893_c0_g1_i1.p1 TRINITY_DN34893_c0_g1~~TRINITY_DN34893_c0_g1_i1.p1  ORF type:complete len:549 (-),score=69.63 TRINITY_DN34893_c0_g1_i1:188-1834(-)